MSSANVDLAQSIFAAWERGDFRSAEWGDPEIELLLVGGPTPGSWRGHAGLLKGWRDFLGAWEEFRGGVDEYRELDGARVFALTHWGGRGRTSGLDLGKMSTESAVLFHFRSGAVTRLVLYFERENAFTDLGLAPEGDAT